MNIGHRTLRKQRIFGLHDLRHFVLHRARLTCDWTLAAETNTTHLTNLIERGNRLRSNKRRLPLVSLSDLDALIQLCSPGKLRPKLDHLSSQLTQLSMLATLCTLVNVG